jgi:hypothetical protein
VAALLDGRVVSGGGDRRAVVWDVTTRKEIAQISCPVYELAIGPLRTGESTLVIAYESSEFSLWQSSMNHRTNCLCIQPDGSWVIRAEWGRILGVSQPIVAAQDAGYGPQVHRLVTPAARTAHDTTVADIRVSSGEESTPQHPRQIAVSAHGPSRMRQGQKACRSAARRAFSLTYSFTERDAADRRSPMPAVDSVWRDCPGGRRRARCLSMLRACGPAATG